jgi:hypothetical protein
MWNRASDIRNFVLNGGCDLGWLLNHLYPEDAPTAVWFIKGSAIHKGVELAIINGLSFDEALYEANVYKLQLLYEKDEQGVIESSSNRSQRGGLKDLDSAIERVLAKWFNTVPPDAPNRMHWYEDYDWPPRTEHMIEVDERPMSSAALYTEVDAIFEGGPEHKPTAIVDWKTGNTKTAAPSQLHIYRYGMEHEGGWEFNDSKAVGWFHHLDHDKIQVVEPYLGHTVVRHWLEAAAAAKVDLVEEGNIVASPDWYCNYCPVKDLCPVLSDDAEKAKSWVQILGRLETAERIPSPT